MKFPFTNYQEINLDWILEIVKKFQLLIPSMQEAESNVQAAIDAATEATGKAETAITRATGAVTTSEEAKNTAELANRTAQAAGNTALAAEATARAANATAQAANATSEEAKTIADTAMEIAQTAYDKAPIIINSASGNLASFPDGAYNMPIKSLIADILPQQTGTGDPSPENDRPISGWTGMTGKRTGKNLNPNQSNQFTTFNTSEFYLKAGTYTFSTSDGTALGQNNAIYFQLLDRNNNVITDGNMSSPDLTLNSARTYYFGGQRKSSFSFDLLADAYVKMGFNNQLPYETYSIQLELGSTATAYEPYTGEDISVTWEDEAGTVYGGKFNVTNGLFTVDKLYKKGGFVRERLDTSGKCWLCGALENSYPYEANEIADAITNYFILSSLEDIRIQNSGAAIFGGSLWIAGYVNNEAALDALLPTLEIVYKMNMPITFQLSPQQINTLYGYNNICVDTGPVSVEYPADTKLYIDNKIASTRNEG